VLATGGQAKLVAKGQSTFSTREFLTRKGLRLIWGINPPGPSGEKRFFRGPESAVPGHRGPQRTTRSDNFPLTRFDSGKEPPLRSRPRTPINGGLELLQLLYGTRRILLEERGRICWFTPLDGRSWRRGKKPWWPLKSALKGSTSAFRELPDVAAGTGKPLKNLAYCTYAVLDSRKEQTGSGGGERPENARAPASKSFSLGTKTFLRKMYAIETRG